MLARTDGTVELPIIKLQHIIMFDASIEAEMQPAAQGHSDRRFRVNAMMHAIASCA
jgi:hypothetical protein